MIDKIEGLHLLHDRSKVQAPSVRVARERSGDAEAIGAGLFLIDPPLTLAPFLRAIQVFEELRPLDAAFHRDRSVVSVERQYAVHLAHIQKEMALAELLPAHRVAAAGHRDRPARRPRAGDRGAHLGDAPWLDDGVDVCGVQL
jgi:hypothetical protein